MSERAGLLGELSRLAAQERERAAAEYSRLLLHRESPAPGDAERLKRAAALLGRSVADVERDVATLAQIEADALEASTIADRQAARLAAKQADAEAAARLQTIIREHDAAVKACERIRGRVYQASRELRFAEQAHARRIAAARKWWVSLGVARAPADIELDVLNPTDESEPGGVKACGDAQELGGIGLSGDAVADRNDAARTVYEPT